MADEQPNLVAGHPPAVKAGGMRIVQHKAPNAERPAKDAEDCTGLTQPVAVNSMSVSGAPVKGNIDYTPQAAQVAHSPKPPSFVAQKPQINIQQPRK
ncbi:death-associated protein 1 [Anastrepha obliqua]|uniref:death-associated protein 1 n=1 Tax=Anastrepha obliqua TaxID=95512 RepID=UPI0023AEF335|nr:death-associated protein 1 isoform X2 [Anastrepha ludens]XP_053964788.1 death-associated protein 1 isoform X2 [Anastrepha ludens]XP_053964789.1 death-associated protein 1 isoform X2 [Anastrepha ludens]XP_053964791.1 death-associated protein 1 isoform X2 [Anastrepha ludens]XP_053964792.1 death-associated protein 1 isoform X2 [Anastrepha ludens]XP_054740012.1 death-associated protein 1 [Anastrepha obliqua]XP_054740013.1 death-associated protein 1 [Anastrepha obliqua]